jgi:uncharacterized protein
LGRFFEEGLGVSKDMTEAVRYYRQAAELGEPFAQLSLGILYRSGNGVAKDNVEAYKWLTLAAAQGFGAEVRDLLAREMTAQQIAEAQQRSSDFSTPERQ